MMDVRAGSLIPGQARREQTRWSSEGAWSHPLQMFLGWSDQPGWLADTLCQHAQPHYVVVLQSLLINLQSSVCLLHTGICSTDHSWHC